MGQTSFLDNSCATFSADRVYRYTLHRRWSDGPMVLWLLLNPSTADETRNDPTIRRCIGYSRLWGYAALAVGNIFALRATDPRALYRHADPIGSDTDDYLCGMASGSALVVAGWGVHGALRRRGTEVRKLIEDAGVKLHVLGLTKSGHPCHPLFLKGDLKPQPWV